jgi:trimeric autotransporter adhesin
VKPAWTCCERVGLLLLLSGLASAQTIITTLAGSRYMFPPDGIAAINAPVGNVSGVTADGHGNVYFSDLSTDRVYRIDSKGILITYAGSGTQGYSGDGGPATSAALFNPRSLVFDSSGNLFISDAGNSRVRKVTPAGIISTWAGNGNSGFSGDGGLAISASFGGNARIALDSGSNLYISDPDNHRIRRVTASGTIFTYAGNGADATAGDGGPAQQASLQNPVALAFDSNSNLYIADSEGNRVRKITPGGIISTVAGTGVGGEAGDGGPATQAHLWGPTGVAVDSTGALLIADLFGSRIRRVDPVTSLISTIAGTSQVGLAGDGGPATGASLYSPTDLFASGQTLLIADLGNFRVRSLTNGVLSTIAGNGNYGYTGDGGIAGAASLPAPDGVVIDQAGNVNICDSFANRVRTVTTFGIINVTAGGNTAGYSGDGATATAATMVDCQGIATDSTGNLYIADTHNRRIRKIDTSGIITTVAGNGVNDFSGDGGPAVKASLSNPQGVAVDTQGNLYIADTGNNRIREVTAAGAIITIAGTGATGFSGDGFSATGAQLNSPSRVAVDSAGNILFTDNGNNVVRRISTTGVISTVAGNGQYGFAGDGGPAKSAMLANPIGLAIDSTGGILIADADNKRIRRVDPNGTIDTVAGNGTSTLSGDGRSPLSTGFGSPADVAVDTAGNLYIADQNNGRVRRIQPKPSSLILSDTGMTFTAAVDAASVSSRTLRILNGGAGAIGWSASTRVLSGSPSWLSVTPNQGTSTNSSSSSVTVSVNPGGLASGNYYGQVQIASPGVANSPRLVTVVLNILSASQTSGPSVSPASFLFTATAGAANPASQTLTVSTLHGAAVAFTASATFINTNHWLTVTPASSSASAGKPASLSLQASSQGLAAGVYTATVNLAFSGGSARSIPVTLAVTGAGATSASITAKAAACTPTQLLPAVTALGSGFTVPAGWPAPMEATVVDDCGQPFTSGTVIATFSNGDPPLAMNGLADGTWSATWAPRQSSSVVVTVTAQSAAVQGATPLHGSVQFNGQVSPNTEPPIVNTGGILNSASFAAGEPSTPGALITVFGSNLAARAASATSLPLPTQLSGSQVILGGVAMPLLYAGPGQINAVVPFTIPVDTTQQVIVISGTTLSVPEPDDVAPGAPATFTLNGSGSGAGIVVAYNPDGTGYIVSTSRPAHPGSVIVVYCTGLGGVQSNIHAGEAAPLSPIAPVTDTVSLTIGGLSAQVLFAGLVPTLSGLYQINVQIPASISTGDAVPVLLNAAGLNGPPVTIAIH